MQSGPEALEFTGMTAEGNSLGHVTRSGRASLGGNWKIHGKINSPDVMY